ncbi:MAG: hypothetical protein KA059_06980 [Elusimicrobiales bacterium]|jgi:small-conductance mechanosensitive channel|nr:hypothetical protein [Elusimicrobiales bacterium]
MYKVLGVTEKLQVNIKIEVKKKTTNPHQNSDQKSEVRGQNTEVRKQSLPTRPLQCVKKL